MLIRGRGRPRPQGCSERMRVGRVGRCICGPETRPGTGGAIAVPFLTLTATRVTNSTLPCGVLEAVTGNCHAGHGNACAWWRREWQEWKTLWMHPSAHDKKATPPDRRSGPLHWWGKEDQTVRRRRMATMPSRPEPSSMAAPGTGTGAVLNVTLA